MFWFKQGLYPGYIIFFVQSALMINGSRGIALPLSICLLLGMLKDYLDLRFDYAFFVNTVIYRWQQAASNSVLGSILAFLNFAYT
jgi:lysophospholipid acyltransferase